MPESRTLRPVVLGKVIPELLTPENSRLEVPNNNVVCRWSRNPKANHSVNGWLSIGWWTQSLHRKWLEITKHSFLNGCLGFQDVIPFPRGRQFFQVPAVSFRQCIFLLATCWSIFSSHWLVNLPPLTHPPRNTGLIAGLMKGNQWFS